MNNFICFIENTKNPNLFLCKELLDDELLSFSTKIIIDNLFEDKNEEYIEIIKSSKSNVVDRLLASIVVYRKLKLNYNVYHFTSNEPKYEFMKNLTDYIKYNPIESNEYFKNKFYINGEN